jgi:hypothetical protein
LTRWLFCRGRVAQCDALTVAKCPALQRIVTLRRLAYPTFTGGAQDFYAMSKSEARDCFEDDSLRKIFQQRGAVMAKWKSMLWPQAISK